MAEPYLGEIRLAGFNYPPQDWALCNGALLNISEYEALFTLIGTTYGGDGQTTFGLPNLQGRAVIHQGNGAGGTYPLGMSTGSETVTLMGNQLGFHTHPVIASNNPPKQAGPAGAYPAPLPSDFFSTDNSGNVTALAANSTAPAGGNQPHNNLMPYQCVNYIIALFGIFPSQN